MDRTVARSTETASRLIDETLLVITVEDSMLHRFNDVGTFIWNFLEKPVSESAICKAVTEHFDGFPEEGRKDIRQFLDELHKKKLVVFS